MSYKQYSDEFKLQVIKDYLNSNLGCRAIAKKYNLPSKNYILNWKNELIKKGFLEETAEKKVSKTNKSSSKTNNKTAYEKQLEKENFELKAKLAFYTELQKLIDEDAKKKE